MEIVYVANSQIPSKTANSVHVMKMCSAFSHNGHSVTLVVPEAKSETENVFQYYGVDQTFEIVRIPYPTPPFFETLRYNYQAGKFASSMNPDLVYGRSMLSCYFASLHGSPVAYESHGPFDGLPYEKSRKFIFKRLIKHDSFNGLFVISDSLRELYLNRCPNHSDNIFTVHDAADPVNSDTEPIELDNRFKLHIGYIGSLYTGRGIDLILNLAESCDFAKFHIIGGTSDDIKYWKQSQDISENVKFYGYLPPAKLDSYRISMDILLAPYQPDLETAGGRNTLNWMSPLKIFEYMASGTPIICSDFPVLREVIEDGKTAIFCSPTDYDEWETAILMLYEDDKMRETLGQNAREVFLNNHTWNQRAEDILAHIDA